MEKKMIPYSLFLPEDIFLKVKELAKERKAAPLIREAIGMVLNNHDAFTAGYHRGISDAAKVVYDCREAQMVAVNGRDIGAVLSEQILELKERK